MNIAQLGQTPENDVKIILAAILSNMGGADLEPLIEALNVAQQRCYEEGISAVFVPHGREKEHLAVVMTGPEKAQVVIKDKEEESSAPALPMVE